LKRYYFDWAATSIPEVFDEKENIVYGNPSSKHKEGRDARAVLEDARCRAAAALKVKPEQLYWTSGGTESNAIVLFSYFKHFAHTNGALLAGSTEHPSVIENCKTIKELGCPVQFIAPSKYGAVTEEALCKKLQTQINMISVMAVNNETGSITDIKKLTSFIREKDARHIFFHSDMVQALGKIPLQLNDIDGASFSAHKIGGPRGIGLLYLKKPIEVLLSGGKQENGIRSGTENVAAALAFAKCIEKYTALLEQNYSNALKRMQYLKSELLKIKRCTIIPSCRSSEDEDEDAYKEQNFSPYILQCAFDNIPGEVMTRALDDAGFAVSTGSACSAANKKRPVLDAMGIDSKTAFNAIRISQGYTTSLDDINALLQAINSILKAL
jgi:cysteine desulfurase